MVDWSALGTALTEETRVLLAVTILLMGIVVAYVAWRLVRGLLRQAGVPEAVEGTPFERTAQGFGTSTVGLVAQLAALFVYVGAVVLALQITNLLRTQLFWAQFTSFLPQLFIAALALIAGLIIGDKAKLVVGERLRSVKLPEAVLIPKLVKYSVFYIAALVALSQIGVSTAALLVLLAAYAFGLVFLGGLAFKDLLAAAAAGIFLLLNEPYSIGDEVRIGDHHGIVQEVDVFVTHIESDGEVYVVPNNRVFESGVVRLR